MTSSNRPIPTPSDGARLNSKRDQTPDGCAAAGCVTLVIVFFVFGMPWLFKWWVAYIAWVQRG